MTKEEAKNVLYEWQEMMVRNGVPIDTSKVQALRVAIEVLSAENSNAKTQNSNQETQKSNGDLIYRADAIEAVIEYWDGYAKPLDSWDVMNQTRAVLETLPSAVCDDCIWHVCNYNKVDWDAPSAEAEGDLISRQDAVNTIKRYKHRLEGKGQTYGFLLEEFEHQIPSAEAVKYESTVTLNSPISISADFVQRWIPCSERLPSEDGSYLVTSSWGKVYTSHYYSEHGRWQYNRRGLIEAWMPLPKPYKEDGEDDGED